MIRHIRFCIRIVVEPDEGEFYAHCPELRGVHAGGATEEEAIQNAKHAAEAYILSLMNNGEPLPLCAEEMSLRQMFSRLASRVWGGKSRTRYEELDLDNAAMA